MSASRDPGVDDPPASSASADAGPIEAAADPALARVLERVRRRARRRVEWLRTLWRDEAGLASGTVVSHAEVDLQLDDRDAPEAEAAWTRLHAADEEARALDAVEAAIADDTRSRLARLCRIFNLGAVERDVLHTCLAAALDPPLLRVFAYLHDHGGRTCVTDALVARLFQRGRVLCLDSDAPLVRWAIVTSAASALGEPRIHALDPGVRDWLLGSAALDPELVGIARAHDEHEPLTSWPVDDTVRHLRRWLVRPEPTAVRVRITGAPASGRRTFAGVVAARLGLPLLVVDAGAVDDAAWPRVYLRAQRQAFLDGCALAFHGEPTPARARPDILAEFPLQFLIDESARSTPLPRGSVDHLVELPLPSLADRGALWRHHAPWSDGWPELLREALVTQHRALPGELARIGRRGPSGPTEATALLRESARESLGELAQRLDGSFTRDDLVLSATLNEAIDDLLFEAHERVAFWERPEARRMFPQGRGLLALFSGPPGTGKTMSAQVIASVLGMDLFRIDLAAVVSKWVGETSRNLDRLLARAAHLDLVILFDEADALFGKRTEIKEANDRFANTDTGYLLQAIESYRGIAVLASNRKADIDPAFLRRLRYVLDFPLPDEAERGRLWRHILGELVSVQRAKELRPDLDRLASAVEATGAQIKLAVLNAHFAARREPGAVVEVRHLVRGLERELAKEGRPLGDRVRERLGARAR